MAHPVTLFTQRGCPDSDRVRACLAGGGVPFAERNVTGDIDAARALMATGMFGTPVVVAGEHRIVGARLPQLVAALGFDCRCSGRDATGVVSSAPNGGSGNAPGG